MKFWKLFKYFCRQPPEPDWRTVNARRVERLRARGVRIGEGCLIFTEEFSSEPYLVELQDQVGVAGGTAFLTHDGAISLLRPVRPLLQHFGRIVVGRGTFIGQNCILLPGTFIGNDCLIGAGSVVRGVIPENSLVVGNPAQVVGRASMMVAWMLERPDSFDSLELSDAERRSLLERHFGIASSLRENK